MWRYIYIFSSKFYFKNQFWLPDMEIRGYSISGNRSFSISPWSRLAMKRERKFSAGWNQYCCQDFSEILKNLHRIKNIFFLLIKKFLFSCHNRNAIHRFPFWIHFIVRYYTTFCWKNHDLINWDGILLKKYTR